MVPNKKKAAALFLINYIIDILRLPGRIFARKDSVTSIDPEKILLVRLDHIGDVVMTSAAFTLIRERFPESEIILLTSSAGKQLFTKDPRIDDIIVYNWPWAGLKKRFSYNKIKELVLLVRKLRKEKIDVLIEFRGDLRFVLLFGVLTGIKIRAGNSRTGSRSLLNYTSSYSYDRHEVERALDVIKCFHSTSRKVYPQINITKEDFSVAGNIIRRETGLLLPSKIAVVAPYSSKEVKSWPKKYFIELISGLIERQFKVILVGADTDERDAQDIIVQFPENVYSLAGKTSVREVAAIIGLSSLVTGVDTGILHIAACFDVPVVAIFGPTRSVEFQPYSSKVSVVQSGSCSCNQFLHLRCERLSDGYARCLNEVRPSVVLKAIDDGTKSDDPVFYSAV